LLVFQAGDLWKAWKWLEERRDQAAAEGGQLMMILMV